MFLGLDVLWVSDLITSSFRFDNFKFQILVLIKLRTFLLTWTLVDADRETLKDNFGNAYLNSIVHEKYNIFPINREISYFTYVGFQNHIYIYITPSFSLSMKRKFSPKFYLIFFLLEKKVTSICAMKQSVLKLCSLTWPLCSSIHDLG